jgi:beta-galactosidase
VRKQLLSQTLALALLVNSLFASFLLPPAAAQSASRFFPAKDLMRIGVYYYPEHWSPEQWDRDFANMERLGFEFVHMGEFAWAFMEPEEGKFDCPRRASAKLCTFGVRLSVATHSDNI